MISSLFARLPLTEDQGMAAMPWTRKAVAMMENFMLAVSRGLEYCLLRLTEMMLMRRLNASIMARLYTFSIYMEHDTCWPH